MSEACWIRCCCEPKCRRDNLGLVLGQATGFSTRESGESGLVGNASPELARPDFGTEAWEHKDKLSDGTTSSMKTRTSEDVNGFQVRGGLQTGSFDTQRMQAGEQGSKEVRKGARKKQ